jgi:hypothetical protein
MEDEKTAMRASNKPSRPIMAWGFLVQASQLLDYPIVVRLHPLELEFSMNFTLIHVLIPTILPTILEFELGPHSIPVR